MREANTEESCHLSPLFDVQEQGEGLNGKGKETILGVHGDFLYLDWELFPWVYTSVEIKLHTYYLCILPYILILLCIITTYFIIDIHYIGLLLVIVLLHIIFYI